MAEQVKSSLWEKIHKIMSEVEGIDKDGYNGHFKYAFTSDANIRRTLRAKLIEHRLIFIPSLLSQKLTVLPDGKMPITEVSGEATLIDIDSNETLIIPIIGQGSDSGDKGVYKGITGGIKYTLINLFLIPTGDDPENDGAKHPTPKPAEATPSKLKRSTVDLVNKEVVVEPVDIDEIINKMPTGMKKSKAKVGVNRGREFWSHNETFHSWVDDNPDGEVGFTK